MFHFDIDYYDSKEQKLFSSTTFAKQLEYLTGKGLDVDPLDILSESMFMEWKDKDGWGNRQELERRTFGRVEEFLEYFDCEAKTLVALHEPLDMGNSRIERAGVGASLKAMGEVIGTTAADWEKLSVGKKKDLDFQVASTGKNFLVVECKGAVVADVTKKDNLSSRKTDIKEKKNEQRLHRSSSDCLIGTILAIPRDDSRAAKIWLVDPPLPEPFLSPYRFKVLSRYRSYHKLIYLIGRPFLLTALSTRIKALESVEDINTLSNVPIVNYKGQPFGIPASFLNNRSRDVSGRIAGIVRQGAPSSERLIFVGIDLSVFNPLVRQSHEELAAWRSELAGRRTVQISVNPSELGLEQTDFDNMNVRFDGSRRPVIDFDVTINSAGLAMGIASSRVVGRIMARSTTMTNRLRDREVQSQINLQ